MNISETLSNTLLIFWSVSYENHQVSRENYGNSNQSHRIPIRWLEKEICNFALNILPLDHINCFFANQSPKLSSTRFPVPFRRPRDRPSLDGAAAIERSPRPRRPPRPRYQLLNRMATQHADQTYEHGYELLQQHGYKLTSMKPLHRTIVASLI